MTPPSPQSDNGAKKPHLVWLRTSSFRELFSIDIRALAVLRIAVGLLVLLDLYHRLELFDFFYGEFGFLDRGTSQTFAPLSAGYWSLYWISDQPLFIGGLMVVSAVSAVGMIFGIRSREMTALTLVLFWSLNVRNPLVTTAGHVLLRTFLFWMLFLPVGATWSLDAWWKNRKGKGGEGAAQTVFSVASAALLIQFAAMYFFSGIAKWNEDWFRGEALQIALQLDLYVKPLGYWLSQYPAITTTATLLTFGFELIGPLLLFMPFGNRLWRVLFLTAFCGMHIGIWMTMSIGIFSMVAIAGWCIFLPAEFWRGRPKPERENPNEKSEPSTATKPNWIVQAICSVFLIYILGLNAANVRPESSSRWFPPALRFVGNLTMVVQEFKMFSRPSHESFWIEIRRMKADGKTHETVLVGSSYENGQNWNPPREDIYSTAKSNQAKRLVHALATPRPETDSQKEMLKLIRERFARSWTEFMIHRNYDGTVPKPDSWYEVNCYRRPIDLDFETSAGRESWLKFQREK